MAKLSTGYPQVYPQVIHRFSKKPENVYALPGFCSPISAFPYGRLVRLFVFWFLEILRVVKHAFIVHVSHD
jgi:hypothetical protein